MNKFYGAHDQWTDLDKQNDVLITSTDGVIDSVKVNGEDYGGGGSSDFSTAEVTVTNNIPTNGVALHIPIAADDEPSFASGDVYIEPEQSITMSVILFKELALATYNTDASNIDVEVTGDIIYDSQYGELQISGNGTISFGSK